MRVVDPCIFLARRYIAAAALELGLGINAKLGLARCAILAGGDNIGLDLVRIRVAALPPAVMNALAGFQRFGRYLGLRSDEVVTIRGARFEAGRFWRAVRTARLYGKSKIRTVDGKRCRVARTDNGVAISGGVAARLADSLCGIFDAAGTPLARFELLLDGLELTATDHAKFLEQGRRARTPNDFSRAWMAARKRSAKATYAALEEAFQPNRPIAGEAFMPPPASALLRYLRLQPGAESFQDRLKVAASDLGAIGGGAVLRRLGGLPIENLLSRLGITADQPEPACGVTPVAVFRWAETKLSQTANLAEQNEIIREALPRIERGTAALVAILSWAIRAFWRDEEFRALHESDRLALMWSHADRVLDAFLRRGADPDLVARFFTEGEFNEPLADRLNLERFLDRDVSSPSTMTGATLTFHLLGALLDDRPVEEVLNAEQVQRLSTSFTAREGEVTSAAPAFTIRNFEGQNVLDSVLSAAPATLRALALEPEKIRAEMISNALNGIEANRDDALSWAMLMQHARSGLSEEELQRARDVVLAVDLAGLAMGARDGLPLPRMILRTMGLVPRTDARGGALEVIRAIARSAAADDLPARLSWGDKEAGTLDPIQELLEICGCYAGIDPHETFERFESAVLAAIAEWLKAVQAFREMIDQLIRINGVVHAAPLWRLHLYLNACP